MSAFAGVFSWQDKYSRECRAFGGCVLQAADCGSRSSKPSVEVVLRSGLGKLDCLRLVVCFGPGSCEMPHSNELIMGTAVYMPRAPLCQSNHGSEQ